MRYEPYFNNTQGTVGFKCHADDGTVSFVYLNPSANEDERDADVFVYNGDTGNPVHDFPECYIVPSNVEQDDHRFNSAPFCAKCGGPCQMEED